MPLTPPILVVNNNETIRGNQKDGTRQVGQSLLSGVHLLDAYAGQSHDQARLLLYVGIRVGGGTQAVAQYLWWRLQEETDARY